MIEVRKLVKRFGLKPVLRGLDFQVGEGEFVALLGPNGAGKTTFLRILSSLSRPTLGEVAIAGYRLPDQAAHVRQRLGVVSHLPLLYGDLTAEENLSFYGKMYGVKNLEKRKDAVLEMVGLSHRRGDLVRTFSRGMQQRLAIGRAVLHDPDVMLFDEPHTGLDQDACKMLDQVLKEVAAAGRTVVMTSHDLARAGDLASRFDVISKGVIVASEQRSSIQPNGLLTFYRDALEGVSPLPRRRRSCMRSEAAVPVPRVGGMASFLRALWAVVWKDLAAELRSRELLSAMLVFALLVIFIFNFCSGVGTRNRRIFDLWRPVGYFRFCGYAWSDSVDGNGEGSWVSGWAAPCTSGSQRHIFRKGHRKPDLHPNCRSHCLTCIQHSLQYQSFHPRPVGCHSARLDRLCCCWDSPLEHGCSGPHSGCAPADLAVSGSNPNIDCCCKRQQRLYRRI
jgi:heme exporter protein A